MIDPKTIEELTKLRDLFKTHFDALLAAHKPAGPLPNTIAMLDNLLDTKDLNG